MEIHKITISETDRILLSIFMDKEYPLEIDWNRLMNVVEKIRDLKMIPGKVFPQINRWEDIVTALMAVDRIKIYNSVIAFIKWYTQNKSPELN